MEKRISKNAKIANGVQNILNFFNEFTTYSQLQEDINEASFSILSPYDNVMMQHEPKRTFDFVRKVHMMLHLLKPFAETLRRSRR